MILEEGRWTLQRKDETPSQAMDRLMRGDDIKADKERIPDDVRKRMDEANTAHPRFSRPSSS